MRTLTTLAIVYGPFDASEDLESKVGREKR